MRPPAETAALPVGSQGTRRVTLLLLLLLLAVNAAAIWGTLSASRSARRLALEDLSWQTQAHGRAVEAALASLRGDLIYLAQASPVGRAPELLAREDPVARRWGRLEVEGALLLFLQAHPAAESLVVWGLGPEPLAAAGRRQGVPALLPAAMAPSQEAWVVRTRWPLGIAPGDLAAQLPGGGGGQLQAEVDLAALAATAVPGLADRLFLEPLPAPAAASSEVAGDGPWLLARALVVDEGFSPPVAFALVRREREGRVVGSVETLTGLFGTAAVVNLAVVALTFALAVVAFRQVRRAARLAAEGEQQARLRRLQLQVAESERLASVGRLAAGMAHEINNPLEGMSSYLTLLEEDLAAGRAEEAPELASRVREGLERIAGITHQVLAYSSPSRAPREPVDLAAVVRSNAAFLGGNPAFRDIALDLQLPQEPVPVHGNATSLHQLVLNLLLNAAEAQQGGPAEGAEGGGGRIEIGLAGGGGKARLTVADCGPGLSPEALRHAFEPFFSTRGGTGLGLAICRGIAADHGGGIRAENRPEGGALITVELPLAGAGEADREGQG